jgi:CelD/BcsL family acetyltransferase involved in cellulose biosynthesis
MLWPLVMEWHAGLRTLRWMGEPVSQYGDVLAEATPDTIETMRQAWQFIVALGADAVVLRKVRADATVAPLLREFGARRTAVDRAPYLDLASAADFVAYEQRFSAKSRKNRRRLMRRLQEHGSTTVERYTAGSRARERTAAAIALKQASLQASGRLAPALADQRFAAFFMDVAEGSTRPAGCGVTVLTCGGDPVGTAIDVTCKGRRAAHIIVHEPRLESCSAGTLLLQEWIRSASADGVATFDLLAPALAYKDDWADGSVQVEDFALGLTLAGRAYAGLYLGALRGRLKEAASMLSRGLSRLQAVLAEVRSRYRRPAQQASFMPSGSSPPSQAACAGSGRPRNSAR